MNEKKIFEYLPNNSFVIDSYVVATSDINTIKKRSVGIVKNITGEELTVFFIGANTTVKTNRNHVAYLDVDKTGKPYDIKICNMCHLLKDMDEFSINQTDAKGRKTRRPSCIECRKEIDRKPLLSSERKKLDKIKPKGVFTCPICKKTSTVGVTANLVRDHDHDTGLGREWICDSCNTGLGRFKDNIETLEEAIEYLKKHS